MAGNQGFPNLQGSHIDTFVMGHKQDRILGANAQNVAMGDNSTVIVGEQDATKNKTTNQEEEEEEKVKRQKKPRREGIDFKDEDMDAIEGKVKLLRDIGFDDTGRIRKALNLANNDVSNALTILTDQNGLKERSTDDVEMKMTQSSETKQDDKTEGYSMKESPIGHCLIISNNKFDKISEVRRGTEYDADNLAATFKWLNFKVNIVENCKAEDIKQKVKEYSAEIHKSFGCFVLCVLSHGDKNGIIGTDGRHVPVADIEQAFHRCKSLVGKPKLFFIQACRGPKQDSGIMPQADHGLPTGDVTSHESDHGNLSPLPVTADFAMTNATPPGYKAWRDITSGSWFISILCEVLKQHAKDQDLIGMLTEVRYRLTKKVGPEMQMQCCETVDRLTKKLYFNPSGPFNSEDYQD